MKKNQIIKIRVVSVAVLMAALAMLLVFGAGSSLFSKIEDLLGGSEQQLDAASASIYNLVFYRGMNACYTVIFGAALSFTVIAAAGVLLRIKGTDICLRAAVYSDIAAGIFLILSYIFEKNIFLRKIFAKIYLGVFAAEAAGERQLGVHVLIVGIFIVVLSVLAGLMLKSSGILKTEVYRADGRRGKYIIFPVLYSVIFMDAAREWAVSAASGMSPLSEQVYGILRDYYFNGRFLLDMPKWIFVLAAALAVIALTAVTKNEAKSFYVILGVLFAGIAAVRCIVFAFNLPALFGVVSLDESVCRAVDTAGYAYIAAFVFDVLFLTVLTAACILDARKKILIIAAVHAVISIVLIFALGSAGLFAVYVGCAAADAAASAVLLYAVYARGGNH